MADEDSAYLERVRRHPCAECGAMGPSHPHHSTAPPAECVGCGVKHQSSPGVRGKGTRAHDHDTMPLCWKCHRQFHDAAGRFAGWDKHDRAGWQQLHIRRTQELLLDPDVF